MAPEVEVMAWTDDPVEVNMENKKDRAVRDWMEWKREADWEYQRTKREWRDSEESKMALEGERGHASLDHQTPFRPLLHICR